jgi:ribonuclease HI
LNVIEYGYLIPFVTLPTSVCLRNNKSALQHREFVECAINELLISGIIQEQMEKPFVVNPLTVSVNSSGKCRLILDLRHVNQCIDKQKFKIEGISNALQLLIKDGFMYKFDLKSGYHHVEIHDQHHKYLGFSWNFGEQDRYFEFTCLPFGLSSAPYLFTKLLRPLVKHWRSKGFKSIVYLDDGWGIAEDFLTCARIAREVQEDLSAAGFVINENKSDFNPTQVIKWLGFSWNTNFGTLSIPEDKVSKFILDLEAIINSTSNLTARQLAKVTGKIISFSSSFGNICNIMSRYLHIAIAECTFWDQIILINDDIINEIKFWFHNCKVLPKVCHFESNKPPEQILFTDASGFAGAGYSVKTNNSLVHYMWTLEQRRQSSTWRELKAVEITVMSLKEIMCNRLVKLYTDNQNVVKIVNKGSMKKELQNLSLSIFSICLQNNIKLETEWIPRSQNEIADAFSKIFDFDDWSVGEHVFQFFNRKWGPFDYDLFADCKNNKVEKFYSRFWNPGTSGVDAFGFDWSKGNNWIVPPVNLTAKAIKHLVLCKARGTLVIP